LFLKNKTLKVTKEKSKIKMKINTQRNSRICCGVPPMSAKFYVFSQTVPLLTIVLYVMLVRTSVEQMVCSSENKWCKFTPKFFPLPAK
jgi:hypothetical protein